MEEGKGHIVRRPTAWERLERRILWIAGVLALAAIGSYVAYHWAWRGAEFGNPDAWGAFGDYFGGTINPLLGLFTLALLLATLDVTRRVRDDTAKMMEDQRKALADQQASMNEQVNLLRAEAQERQLKTKLEAIEGRLAAALEAWRELCGNSIVRTRNNAAQVVLRDILYSRLEWGNFRLRCGYSRTDPADDSWKDQARKALATGCPELKNMIPEFAQYCTEFEEAGGAKLVTDFYRSRLEQPLHRLTSIGYVEEPIEHILKAPNRTYLEPMRADEPLIPGPEATS